jgi:hypothetical protein
LYELDPEWDGPPFLQNQPKPEGQG